MAYFPRNEKGRSFLNARNLAYSFRLLSYLRYRGGALRPVLLPEQELFQFFRFCGTVQPGYQPQYAVAPSPLNTDKPYLMAFSNALQEDIFSPFLKATPTLV